MRNALFQFASIAALSSAAFAQSRVIITEIMYNPASTEQRGEAEWIEIANVGSEAVEIKNWTLKVESKKTKWGTFNCTLAPGGVAVLVNSDAVSEDRFHAAWDQPGDESLSTAQSNYQVIGLKWGALANNPGENALQLINEKEEIVCEVKQKGQWPKVTGAGGPSIFLTDITASDLSDGSLWRISYLGMDGARNNVVTDVFDKSDIGSPGYVPGLNGNPAATTPAQQGKEKQPKKDAAGEEAVKPTAPPAETGNKIDY